MLTVSDRYLLRAVFWPWLAVTAALAAIFASYSVTRYLAEAAQGQQAMRFVAEMIGLRVVVALEVLLPLGLYLGIIIGLGRLYADSEMIALQAGGLGRSRMLRPLLAFALVVSVLVAALSLYGRPWAYGKLYAVEVAAEARLDLNAITPRRFYTSDDAAIYANSKSDNGHQLNDVFARFIDDERRVVIRAAHMRRSTDADGAPTLDFRDGHLYQLDMQGPNDRVVGFGKLQWHLAPSSRVVGYKRKAASSASLLQMTDRDDIAERQWRYSRPVAVIFLALLGIVFARSTPRRGRAGNMVAAAVSFALYYGLASVARSWVEQGVVAIIPGVYWVDALVGAIACVLLFRRRSSY
ncbi:LPS export ABC transporter permease LptF [Salinisphaera aquimarina]|uniref:Lipopolysaccharide export system permease protein LptF n=1 Tax=Salinisphaera aquimarina TaxID=2094031 RepID=A0ABV7EL81_9GAMM